MAFSELSDERRAALMKDIKKLASEYGYEDILNGIAYLYFQGAERELAAENESYAADLNQIAFALQDISFNIYSLDK